MKSSNNFFRVKSRICPESSTRPNVVMDRKFTIGISISPTWIKCIYFSLVVMKSLICEIKISGPVLKFTMSNWDKSRFLRFTDDYYSGNQQLHPHSYWIFLGTEHKFFSHFFLKFLVFSVFTVILLSVTIVFLHWRRNINYRYTRCVNSEMRLITLISDCTNGFLFGKFYR